MGLCCTRIRQLCCHFTHGRETERDSDSGQRSQNDLDRPQCPEFIMSPSHPKPPRMTLHCTSLWEDPRPREAIFVAASKGNTDEMMKLINDGFQPNSYLGEWEFSSATALTVAARYGHVTCVRKLIDLGVLETDKGRVIPKSYIGAIVYAASRNDSHCVQLLVEGRLFRDTGNKDMYAPFISAAQAGEFDRVQTLLNASDDVGNMLKGWRGQNLMSLFLFWGCPPSCLDVLIDNGVDVNGWDFNGLTPLMCAILGANIECVQFLLDQGADVKAFGLGHLTQFLPDGTVVPDPENIYDKPSRTALMYAACIGNIPILQLMLQKVTLEDINLKDEEQKFFPLSFAVIFEKVEAVSLLLQNDADVNLCTECLPSAVDTGNMELFSLLLKKTTKMEHIYHATEKSISSKKPLFLARLLECYREEILTGGNGRDYFRMAVCYDSVGCGIVLMDYGYDAHLMDSDRINSLHFSCQQGRYKFIELLIKRGIDVNVECSCRKETAIMIAAYIDDVDCFQLLMDAGADLDKLDESGGTVYTTAAMSGPGTGKCLQLLLKSGKLEYIGKGLNPIHSNAVKILLKKNFRFDMNRLLISMQVNFFDWEWCLHSKSLTHIAYAAVTLGVSPGIFSFGKMPISLMSLAFIRNDLPTFQYLLANLYFFPEDYRFLLNKAAISSSDEANAVKHGYLQPTSAQPFSHGQPLSLQSWSFLTISRAISTDVFSNDRTAHVNALPLPEEMKTKLKFKTVFSHLSSRHWWKLGSDTNLSLGNAVFDKKKLLAKVLENCSSMLCDCDENIERDEEVRIISL